MSVRREVVTLSQLLRRNESSSSRRGADRAPPLPLQRSRRQPNSAPFAETPASARHQPLSFTQQVRDASRGSTLHPEIGASSQTSSAALSQEVYDPESQQLSAITSMSQSSFSQTQSQNLLGSSQDDQLLRLQQWQAQQARPAVLPPPAHCDHNEKLRELEKNLTQALVEQTCQHKQHQRDLMAQFASPIEKSVEDIKEKLETCSGDLNQQRTSLAEVAADVKGVAASITDLQQQTHENKAACEETHKAVTTEAAVIKAALAELRTRVDTVEGSVNSCSEKLSRVLEGEKSRHEALLSAVAASSCKCPQNGLEVNSAEVAACPTLTSKKRRRSPGRYDVAEANPARYMSSPSVDDSPPRSTTRFSSRYTNMWQEGETASSGLHHALERIQALRSKRRSCQYMR